jgi:hypothetical protein
MADASVDALRHGEGARGVAAAALRRFGRITAPMANFRKSGHGLPRHCSAHSTSA